MATDSVAEASLPSAFSNHCLMNFSGIKCYLRFLLIITLFLSLLVIVYQKGALTPSYKYNSLAPPLAEPSQKLNVILLTYMRSGSTVIGEIFRKSPGVFYLYEPLRLVHEKLQIGNRKTYDTLERPDFIAEEKKWLKELFNCNFENTLFEKNNSSFHPHSLAGTSALISSSSFSFSRNQLFASKSLLRQESTKCQSQRMRVIKTIRITNLQNIWREIESDPNTKIIHLLRDPRAVQNSRLRLKVHLGPRWICDWPMRTIEFSHKENLADRGRYTELVFGKFAENPVASFRNIFKFLGLELSRSSEEMIRNLTQSSDVIQGGFLTRNRNASLVAKSWETSLDEKNRKWIEDDPTCKKLIEHIYNRKL